MTDEVKIPIEVTAFGVENFADVTHAMEKMDAAQLMREALMASGAVLQRVETGAVKDAIDPIKDQSAALERLVLQKGQATTFGAALTAEEFAYANSQMAAAAATNVNVLAMLGAGPVWFTLTWLVAAASLALWPFTAVVLSAGVALISMTAGMAGFVGVLVLAAAPLAAFLAGVLLLGGGGGVGAMAALTTATTRLFDAQQALKDFIEQRGSNPLGWTIAQGQQHEDLLLRISRAQVLYNDALTASQGPTGVLIAQLTAMKNTLAEQASPLALMITQWVGGAIPAITQFGQSIMTWFGDRLPRVLAEAGKFVYYFSGPLQDLSKFMGHFLDEVGQRWPAFSGIIQSFVSTVLIPAIEGLMTNLLRLSDWFVKELPTLGPIVNQVFSWMGRMIQWVADHWAQLTDFVEHGWQATVKNAMTSLGQLNQWWKDNGATIQTFAGNVVGLMVQFNLLIGIWIKVYNFLNGVGLTPNNFLAAVSQIMNWLQTAAGYATTIANALNLGGGGGGGTGRAFNPRGGNQFIAGATGFSGMVAGPTLFLAGEDGPEHVQITPSGGAGGNMGETNRLLRQIADHLAALRASDAATASGGVEAAIYKVVAQTTMNRSRGMAGA